MWPPRWLPTRTAPRPPASASRERARAPRPRTGRAPSASSAVVEQVVAGEEPERRWPASAARVAPGSSRRRGRRGRARSAAASSPTPRRPERGRRPARAPPRTASARAGPRRRSAGSRPSIERELPGQDVAGLHGVGPSRATADRRRSSIVRSVSRSASSAGGRALLQALVIDLVGRGRRQVGEERDRVGDHVVGQVDACSAASWR